MNNGASPAHYGPSNAVRQPLHYDEATTRQRRAGVNTPEGSATVYDLGERIAGATSFAGEGHQAALDQTIEGSAELGRLGIDRLA
jgi:hypothetical protein